MAVTIRTRAIMFVLALMLALALALSPAATGPALAHKNCTEANKVHYHYNGVVRTTWYVVHYHQSGPNGLVRHYASQNNDTGKVTDRGHITC